MLRQNFVQIDLAVIRENYRLLRDAVSPRASVIPVIKANAYGHGLIETVTALSRMGANHFAVALAEEGIELRLAGFQDDILVLGATMPSAVQECIQYGLTQTVFTPEMVYLLDQEAAKLGKEALVHIKLDTGMNRIGLKTEEEAAILADSLKKAPHVRATGIYTHFADAEHLTEEGELHAFSCMQIERFRQLRAFFDPSLSAHASNSAMTLLNQDAWFDSVREGISLYGYPPVPTSLPLIPALSWTTEIVHVKNVSAGESIGYGCAYTAEKNMKIATVAVGYGDGYHRALSNQGKMIVHGRLVPIVGRVCMDQTMVDVTEIPEVRAGDEAVLIGRQGNEKIDAEMLADWADTICYEILLSISPRVPRVFLNE